MRLLKWRKKLESDKLPKGVNKVIKKGILKAKSIKGHIIDEKGSIYSSEMLQGKMIQVYSSISMYGGRPNNSQLTYIGRMKSELNEVGGKFESFVKNDMVKINRFMKNYQAGEIKIISEEEYIKKNKD